MNDPSHNAAREETDATLPESKKAKPVPMRGGAGEGVRPPSLKEEVARADEATKKGEPPNRDDLISWSRLEAGQRATPREVIFFFEAEESAGPRAALSNYHPSPFRSGGHTFAHVEQYMHAAKALEFGDRNTAARIMKERRPKVCKVYGRAVTGFEPTRWSHAAVRAVEHALYQKFDQNAAMRATLLDTGDAELVEAAAYDRVWGIGYNATDAATTPRSRWGLNLLGRLLVRVRFRLRAQMPAPQPPHLQRLFDALRGPAKEPAGPRGTGGATEALEGELCAALRPLHRR